MTELAEFTLGPTTVLLRRARADDVPAIVELIADDRLVPDSDDATDYLAPYRWAFDAIDADPAQLLVIGVDGSDTVVSSMQISFIPGLARFGALRAHIEAVRVAENWRNRGLGSAMLAWAIDEARSRGCGLVQLMSNLARTDAQRFYERMGFALTHNGMKLYL